MILLPSLLKRVLAGSAVILLASSLAQATVYSDAVNSQLQLQGKNIQTATVAQLQAAMNASIASDPTHAGEYLHDILMERTDRNTLALNFTTGAIQTAGVASNPVLTGSIVGQGSATDLQVLLTNPLKLTTISTVSSGVLKKLTPEVKAQAALNIAAAVASNLPLYSQKVTYTTSVAPTLLSTKSVLGAFVAGISTVGNAAEIYTNFTKDMVAKYPTAASDICYSVIALSGTSANDRIAASGTFAVGVSFDSTAAMRGSIAQGIVKAAGTANTATVINSVLNAGRGKAGKEVLLSNLPNFTSAVAGAVTVVGDQGQADLMRTITATIASGTYSTALGQLAAPLNDTDKAKVGAAAVKVAPVSIAGGSSSVPVPNPANAAVAGILSTGVSNANIFSFAITVARGTRNYENVGQVGNAVANQLTSGTSLPVNGTTAPTDYVAVSGSLIKAFPNAAAEISRRIAQLIPANDVIQPNESGTNQAARINFAKELVTKFPASAANIAMGIVKTDPNCADNVTAEIAKLNKTAAVAIVTKVSNSVPAEEASEIALKIGGLIANKILPLTQAGTLASAIANGALVKNSGSELPIIAAQMIGQLMSLYVSTDLNPTTTQAATNKSVITAIGTIAGNVARIAFGANKNPVPGDATWNSLTRFADQIAGASVQMLTSLGGLNAKELSNIITTVSTKVQAVVPTKDGKNLVAGAVGDAQTSSNAFVYKVLLEVETPVTNF